MINTKYQTLATFTLPTSVYAFYRIKKLRLGLLVNLLSILLSVSSFSNMVTLLSHGYFGFWFLLSGFILIYSYVIPIIFIRKWTNSYNNKVFQPEKTTNSK